MSWQLMLSLLCGLSDALFYERESFGVHGSFVGKNQKKKNIEGCSIVLVLEGKEQEAI